MLESRCGIGAWTKHVLSAAFTLFLISGLGEIP